MYTKWNTDSLNKYDDKVSNAIAHCTEHMDECVIHMGKGNSKTDCIEEGTSAGIKGTCDPSCCGNCREGCYAIVHQDGVYKACLKNHAENTIMRRKNREAYYTAFFEFANKKGKPLRVNESGDFECEDDVFALMTVANKYPSVKVIGYTKRANLLSAVAMLNALGNVMIHYSIGINGDKTVAENYGVPTATITFNHNEVKCLNQLFKKKGKVWTCRMCAEKGIGCFANKPMVFDAH